MSKLIHTVLGSRAGYGLTVLRIFVGIIFAAHGSQKLFGWFGGGGLAGTALGLSSPRGRTDWNAFSGRSACRA